MSGIFKAYDIRGLYGKELTPEIAERIGRAYITFTKAKKVAIGHDCRVHSKPLFDALSKGILRQGADVVDLGLCSTPMSYFANGTLHCDGSVIITASHNPAEWNGFKLCRANAVPISGATGIADIERIVAEGSFDPEPATPGKLSSYDILPEYARHVATFHHASRRLRVAVDFANGMGILEGKAIAPFLDIDPLYGEFDGTFPNHEANPLKTETMADLQAKVRAGGYDFGVAFDGDADRAGFVDEKGDIISMDFITALIAEDLLGTHKGEVVFYDLRSSKVCPEVITAAGGKPMMCRVGHAFIKQQMRDNNAIFAGELSGHYYFRDNFTAESSSMAVLSIANIVANSGKKLSELVAPLRKYCQSGEINSRVSCPTTEILDRIRRTFADGEQTELDGVSVAYPGWWFNVRCSNTEPLVRLNLEADTPELMAEKRDAVLAVIRA